MTIARDKIVVAHGSALLLALASVACGGSAARPAAAGGADAGSVQEPTVVDYEAVFPQDRVIRLDVRIAASDWAAMTADMESMAGAFGSGGGFGPPSGDAGSRGPFPPGAFPDGGVPDGLPPGGPGLGGPFPPGVSRDGGAAGELLPRTPIYVPSTVQFQGQTWHNVGIRFKGNSSLALTWSQGINKLPFRLDFDELQDRFPEVSKQRFLGLKALSLTNGFSDPALIRDKVMADLFREGGVRAARTGFVRLHIDRGNGPEYFGLYDIAEVPGKSMLEAQFGNDDGNLYKPEGTGAQLRTFDQSSFEKKTNQNAADYSDVRGLGGVLN